MSSSDTNIKRQARRHRPAIWGISAALLIALVAALGLGAWPGPPLDNQAAADRVVASQ